MKEQISKLKYLAKLQNAKSDLPDYLLNKILKIEQVKDKKLLDVLIKYVEQFSPDAGLGCFSDGYSAKDIEEVLKKL
ncbi:GSU3529 family protein [Deferribacter abyssi]|uniref:GSU3529 family protein n=1 Tax=Deferribacter abyssi TaxID=213806 RepID=UPI003C13F78D